LNPIYTDHAFERARERGLAPQHVYYAARYGTRFVQRDGTVKRVLRYANLPKSDQKSHAALVGLTVVLDASEHVVITLYHDLKLM
jgi:hypothetical protein